jgi:pyruvate dehydrogenase E1 component alpha subunit
MYLIREFEEQVKYLFLKGSMPGTIHQCQGQEATAVGVCTALRANDYVTSTHRPHGHALAKGLTPLEILIELFGKGTGCCKGKGGSLHIGNISKGMVPAIAIVGGGLPIATGIGLAFKMQKSSQVVACFFGDGASSEGAFHESVNMAAIWNLPVIFACENNLYGASTHISKITRVENIASKAAAYDMPAETIAGNDVLAVYEASEKAAKRCRSGEGPVLLELMTYRITGHSRRDPCHYQPREEKKEWLNRDPIKLFRSKLLKRKDIPEQELEQISSKVTEQIANAIQQAQREPEPGVVDLTTDVYV